jgi:hypothetical protein
MWYDIRIENTKGSNDVHRSDKKAIETLPDEDYVQLRKWFSGKDWRKWDKRIAADSDAGKLDFLVKEAFDGKRKGKLRGL